MGENYNHAQPVRRQKKVTIAVIGTGLIGPRHAQAIIEDETAELIAVVDPSPSGETIAKKFNVPHFTSVKALIETNSPDAAIICTPNHTHVAIGIELARAKIHILVEKPISTTINEGRLLISEAKNNNISLLVGHHRRFNSYITAAKSIIDTKLGQVTAINGLWTLFKPLSYFDPPSDWRRSQGVIQINLIHEIDTLHYLFGRVTRVYAEKTISHRGYGDEGAAITLRFASNAVATFLVSDHTPSPHNFEAGTGENPTIPKTGSDFYRVFGTDACLSIPDMTLTYYSENKKSWTEQLRSENVLVDVVVPFKEQIRHLVDVVHGGVPRCTGEDGLAAVIVCDAILTSLRTELPVTIDYLCQFIDLLLIP